MNQTANRLRHIHNEAAIVSQSNPFEVMMNGLKEEFGCVSQRYDAIMDIALFYIADELDELQAKVDDLRKQVPSERERQILDMWPRFEDGEPVMLGDKYEDNEGHECFASGVHLDIDGPSLVDSEGFHDLYRKGKRVKRPVQSVLDADGVEIKVGDTVWHEDGSEQLVEEMNRYGVRCFDGDKRRTFDPKYLTHTRPDSWERLEEDAELNDETGVVGGNLDIVRRAKALAGMEVGR